MYYYRKPVRGGAGIFGICLSTFSFIVALALIGCDSHSLTDDNTNTIIANSELAKHGGGESDASTRSTVYSFDDLAEVGYSIVKRSIDNIAVSYSASDLIARHTYTLWWVVFDQPSKCSPDPADISSTPVCGEDDVVDAMEGGANEPEVTILGAADGAVASEWGHKNFRGILARGDDSTSIFGDGLDNPTTAEIHLVLRSHGEAIPGLVREQITTFNGGCDPGQPNEGLCHDVQFSVHVAN